VRATAAAADQGLLSIQPSRVLESQSNQEGNRMERKKASDFPRELLDLFDGYVHGGISRREFMEGAQKFAVGGVTAAALFRMLKPNYARALQVPTDDKRITTEIATVPSPRGNGAIKGYLVRPANASKLPSVLVIHENLRPHNSGGAPGYFLSATAFLKSQAIWFFIGMVRVAGLRAS
jgi:hypothetical protein